MGLLPESEIDLLMALSAIVAARPPGSSAVAAVDGVLILTQFRENPDGSQTIEAIRIAKVGGPEGVRAGRRYYVNAAGSIVEADG